MPTESKKKYFISQENHIFFVDYILIPALQKIIGDKYSGRYPMSWKQETAKSGVPNRPYYVNNTHYTQLKEVMADIISKNRDREHKYCYFEDFFFCTYTYGNKIEIPFGLNCPHHDQTIKNAFPQIDYSNIPTDSIFVDIAWEVQSHNQTAIWYHEGNYLPVLGLFFDNVRFGSRVVYRHDEYASVRELAGCKYTTYNIEGEGPHRILQFQAYHTIKTAFFRRTTGNRHTFDIHSDILSESEEKSTSTFVSFYFLKIYFFFPYLFFH